jgi:hypothetical protein
LARRGGRRRCRSPPQNQLSAPSQQSLPPTRFQPTRGRDNGEGPDGPADLGGAACCGVVSAASSREGGRECVKGGTQEFDGNAQGRAMPHPNPAALIHPHPYFNASYRGSRDTYWLVLKGRELKSCGEEAKKGWPFLLIKMKVQRKCYVCTNALGYQGGRALSFLKWVASFGAAVFRLRVTTTNDRQSLCPSVMDDNRDVTL